MAKYMDEEGGYRAVVEVKTYVRDSKGNVIHGTGFDYIGPYNGIAQAKSAVTVNRAWRGKEFVDGWVEKATWQRVE